MSSSRRSAAIARNWQLFDQILVTDAAALVVSEQRESLGDVLRAAPATNPKSASDVPLTPTVQALPTWYYRPEEWTVKA